jgi:hypothetical protein
LPIMMNTRNPDSLIDAATLSTAREGILRLFPAFWITSCLSRRF